MSIACGTWKGLRDNWKQASLCDSEVSCSGVFLMCTWADWPCVEGSSLCHSHGTVWSLSPAAHGVECGEWVRTGQRETCETGVVRAIQVGGIMKTSNTKPFGFSLCLCKNLWDRSNGHPEMRQQARLSWQGDKGNRVCINDLQRCATAAHGHFHVFPAARNTMLLTQTAGK